MRHNDSLLIVICLTAITLGGVTAATDMSLVEAIQSWGRGLHRLNAFITQIALILVVSNVLAHTRPMAGLIERAASLPQTDTQAYLAVAVVSGIASLLSGALGLVIGGVIALGIARQMKQRQLPVDFPLLVAAAYSGFVVWHMGLNGVAPLFMASDSNEMIAITERVIPVSETIFAHWNITLAILVLVSVAALCVLMRPRGSTIVEIADAVVDAGTDKNCDSFSPLSGQRSVHSLHSLPTMLLASIVFAYLVIDVVMGSQNIDFNIIIWTFLGLGLLLSGGSREFSYLSMRAASSVAPVLIQYPLYAGIMGLLTDSGVVHSLSTWVANYSSQATLGVSAFLSAGLVNLFIPSGGGQWVVQGPIFLEAARMLDVDYAVVIMAVAYGDQWTNMIQPFWTLPLLAIVGLNPMDIFHYMVKIFLLSGALFGSGLYVISVM